MKKIFNQGDNNNKIWFNWITQQLSEHETFSEFDSGGNPQEVAENFISINKLEILKFFDNFDEEDEDALCQLQKLIECELHVFRILKNQLEFKKKVKYVDFKNKSKSHN